MAFNDLSKSPVQFDELADKLVEMGGGSHPSELHGLICGLFSGGSRPGVEAWLRQVSGLLGDETMDGMTEDMLTHLYQQTLEQLSETDFSIRLLMPDDDDALEQRAEALGIWCSAFLSGFGEGATGKVLGENVESVLRDFSEIAQIHESIDDSEESEKDFMEISEYVRMALLTVFSEVNQGERGKEAQATLH
ncbi:MAG: UPF0149 family protein [Endozoicomonas sp.]